MDPLLHVVIAITRSLRRWVFLCRGVALRIIQADCDFQGSRPFGPASSFRRYLQLVGWDVCPNAKLCGPDHCSIDLLGDSCSKIAHTFRKAWPHFLISNLSRKGTGDFLPHSTITARVMARFSFADQALLLRNLAGGFQTAAIQRIWGSDVSVACPLCGEDDKIVPTVAWNAQNYRRYVTCMWMPLTSFVMFDQTGCISPKRILMMNCRCRGLSSKHYLVAGSSVTIKLRRLSRFTLMGVQLTQQTLMPGWRGGWLCQMFLTFLFATFRWCPLP